MKINDSFTTGELKQIGFNRQSDRRNLEVWKLGKFEVYRHGSTSKIREIYNDGVLINDFLPAAPE